MNTAGRSPVFLDIEASGIAERCYPIEVGLAHARVAADGAMVLVAESRLITPPPAWCALPAAWDSKAEPVHGLTMARLLDDGESARQVCAWLDATLAGCVVGCDTGAHGWDADWAATLYAAAEQAPAWALAERTAGALVAERFRECGLVPRVVRPALLPWAPPATHAAAEDALRFAWEWGMAHLLAAAGVAALPDAQATAAMADLPGLVAREKWPQVEAGRFRRRADAT